MGAGADVAISASDITLVRSDPDGDRRPIRLSRQTLRIIKQNLFWRSLQQRGDPAGYGRSADADDRGRRDGLRRCSWCSTACGRAVSEGAGHADHTERNARIATNTGWPVVSGHVT